MGHSGPLFTPEGEKKKPSFFPPSPFLPLLSAILLLRPFYPPAEEEIRPLDSYVPQSFSSVSSVTSLDADVAGM